MPACAQANMMREKHERIASASWGKRTAFADKLAQHWCMDDGFSQVDDNRSPA